MHAQWLFTTQHKHRFAHKNGLNHEQKTSYTNVSAKDLRVSILFLWLISECSSIFYFDTCSHYTVFSIQIFIVSDRLFASSTLRNVLKLNEPIKWIVTDDLLPQTWNEKVSLIGWGGFMFSSISNYNKIATNLSSKTTIDNNCYQDYFCHWLPPVNIS